MTRFLRLPQVVARVGLSPMTLWRREHANPPSFPRRVKLSVNAVGWPEDEIEAWCAARLAERDRGIGLRGKNEAREQPEAETRQ